MTVSCYGSLSSALSLLACPVWVGEWVGPLYLPDAIPNTFMKRLLFLLVPMLPFSCSLVRPSHLPPLTPHMYMHAQDFRTPPTMRQAMATVLDDGCLGYSDPSPATTAAAADNFDVKHGFGGV